MLKMTLYLQTSKYSPVKGSKHLPAADRGSGHHRDPPLGAVLRPERVLEVLHPSRDPRPRHEVLRHPEPFLAGPRLELGITSLKTKHGRKKSSLLGFVSIEEANLEKSTSMKKNNECES